MTTIRPFTCSDLFKFNNVNLDPLTETYGLAFYMQYLAQWPEYFQVAESPSGEIMGYIMGKAEGRAENWHGHVTALSVSPEHRRLGLAAKLMNTLEEISERKKCFFLWIYSYVFRIKSLLICTTNLVIQSIVEFWNIILGRMMRMLST